MAKATQETEKNATEVFEAVSKNEKVTDKYKLADANTQYAEPRFTLVGDQEKELPENPSLQLIERIRSGFIIKV